MSPKKLSVVLAVSLLITTVAPVGVFGSERSSISTEMPEIKEELDEDIKIFDAEPADGAESVSENTDISVYVKADTYPIEVVFYLEREEIYSETLESEGRVGTDLLDLESNITYEWKVEANPRSDDLSRETVISTYTFATGLEGYYTLNIQRDRVQGNSANEEQDHGVDPDRFGKTKPESGKHEYEPGTNVTVKALPNEGWRFSHWIVDEFDRKEDAELTIEMDENISLRAYFKILDEDEYIGSDTGYYEPGEPVIIEVKNDGSATNWPILRDFDIYIENVETGEVVYGPLSGVIQPMKPEYGHTESFVWDQTDQKDEQVPEGLYRVKAESKFDHTAEFRISEDKPQIEFSNLRVEADEVKVDENVEVRVDVTNLGEETIEYSVDFYIYGPCRWSIKESITITVEGGETETVFYNYTPVDKPGEHSISVMENDEITLSTSIEVEEERRLRDFLVDTWWLIAMMIFIVALVGAAVIIVEKRKNPSSKMPTLQKKDKKG